MKVLYYLTYAVLWLFSLLPMWVHYLISDGIYVVVYHRKTSIAGSVTTWWRPSNC